jgi:hypothetical protein
MSMLKSALKFQYLKDKLFWGCYPNFVENMSTNSLFSLILWKKGTAEEIYIGLIFSRVVFLGAGGFRRKK